MFLTITIDTTKKGRSNVKKLKSKFSLKSWRKPLNARRRSFIQKVSNFFKQIPQLGRTNAYRPAAF